MGGDRHPDGVETYPATREDLATYTQAQPDDAYLAARARTDTRYTLRHNQRSAPALIEACNRLFGANPAVFMMPGLEYVNVGAGSRPRTPLVDDTAPGPVPPLRQRREDIPQLAEAILKRLAGETADTLPALSEEAEAALTAYPFPGNVRELENILERAVALCDGQSIEVADLYLPQVDSLIGTEDDMPLRPVAAAPSPAVPAGLADGTALPDAIEQMERETIQKALEANRYNKTKTAAQLGITFRALRYKLKKLGME